MGLERWGKSDARSNQYLIWHTKCKTSSNRLLIASFSCTSASPPILFPLLFQPRFCLQKVVVTSSLFEKFISRQKEYYFLCLSLRGYLCVIKHSLLLFFFFFWFFSRIELESARGTKACFCTLPSRLGEEDNSFFGESLMAAI